jgi:hypothetical protein
MTKTTEELKIERDDARARLAELRKQQGQLRDDIYDAEEEHRQRCAAYNASVVRDRRRQPEPTTEVQSTL